MWMHNEHGFIYLSNISKTIYLRILSPVLHGLTASELDVIMWEKRMEANGMGLTVTSLHIWKGDAQALRPKLRPGDALRGENAPWLSILPGGGEADTGYRRMLRLARAVEEPALFFHYFDDDYFEAALYVGGKRVASSRSGTRGNARCCMSFIKLGKALDAVFGDDLASRALRLIQKAKDLDEELTLFEEVVGLSLTDVPEFPSRRVPRCDATAEAVRAREKTLRGRIKARGNAYELVPVSAEDLPALTGTKLRMFEALRGKLPLVHLYHLLRYAGSPMDTAPGQADFIAMPAPFYRPGSQCFLLCDGRSGRLWIHDFGLRPVARVVRATERGYLCELTDDPGHGIVRSVGCLDEDNRTLWQFAPDPDGEMYALSACRADEDAVTVFLRAVRGEGSRILRLDARDGRVLNAYIAPKGERLDRLLRLDALPGYAWSPASSHEFVVLDEALNETARWPMDPGWTRPDLARCDGGTWVWNYPCFEGAVKALDLRTGAQTSFLPEIACNMELRLPNGDWLALINNFRTLLLLDGEGRVISRHPLGSGDPQLQILGEEVYVTQVCSPTDSPFISSELVEQTRVNVWRLVKVK